MRLANLLIPIVVTLGAGLYLAAHQNGSTVHFGIGRWDSAFLANQSAFHPPTRMSGPVRHDNGSVEVREFVGRLTRSRAVFEFPYHARRSPVHIRIRCHRFGLGGTVSLTVNDHHIDDFVFTEGSYPWAGIRAVIPQSVAESGPLRVQLDVNGGARPPEHLPSDLGVGVDWVELEPMSKGVTVLPTRGQWARFGGTLGLVAALLVFVGATRIAIALSLGIVGLFVSVGTWFALPLSFQVLSVGWLVLPAAAAVLWSAELLERFFPPPHRT
jgi:hypothetical protein